jgi:hypothetical protein
MTRIEHWKGNNYEQGLGGKRVLVLGLSSYDPKFTELPPGTDHSRIVIDNVEDMVFKGRGAFFTKVAKLLLKATRSSDDSRKAIQDTWHRIAFHNYLQDVLSGPRIDGNLKDKRNEQVLRQSLTVLKPEVMVVLGNFWEVLPQGLRDWPGMRSVKVAHPSGRFSYEPWVAPIRASLVMKAHA